MFWNLGFPTTTHILESFVQSLIFFCLPWLFQRNFMVLQHSEHIDSTAYLQVACLLLFNLCTPLWEQHYSDKRFKNADRLNNSFWHWLVQKAVLKGKNNTVLKTLPLRSIHILSYWRLKEERSSLIDNIFYNSPTHHWIPLMDKIKITKLIIYRHLNGELFMAGENGLDCYLCWRHVFGQFLSPLNSLR